MPCHVVCRAEELPEGGRIVVEVEGRSVAVFNVDGHLHAVRNVCPHQGAELGAGTVGGTMVASRPQEYVPGLDGRVLRCPWHGWEFGLAAGCALFAPERVRVRTFTARVEGDDIVVE